MTDYILEATSIEPLSKSKPKNAIVLCHGYGGDGKDISALAINWQRFLPDSIFVCPNAPEICTVNPQGFQWFDLTSDKEEIILEKSLTAEKKLSKFLDQVLDNFQLEPKNQRPFLDGGLGTHQSRLRPGFLFSLLYHSNVMNSALPPNMPVIAPSLWRLLIPSE